ncbi:M15 family metallopeptidase [Clostridium bowmanii]|uniref:M15 family metallopeptidase n=1 Tax=Clostridium bowmanii TaxID=132925 RepID=UPI001C0C047A|nr:M15 family metallopeptidase [Clostridium bowmanii]MBU3191735.1 M15 family metallopeptidase [Clostridium bowmanii]MCA1076048.1 M15 family metallopeptidase [Clostridium bowmanii]
MTIKYFREVNNLVNVSDMDSSFIFDLKYATTDNFTKTVVYPVNVCVLQRETALKLINANAEFKKLGYRIKIWDAYRPMYVQKIFWDLVFDERFIANPNKKGSRHSSGTAVDITLVNEFGKELKMPSNFDDFSDKACRNYEGMSEEELKNINFLTGIMEKYEFITIDTEWWHFEDCNYSEYKITDVEFELFIM